MLTSRFGVPHATPSGISMSALFNPGARFRRMNRRYFAGSQGWWRPRYTPAKASWLNQAAILIHAFKHYYLKRVSWKSQEEFKTHVLASWPDYNHRYAHPFEWTWTNQKMRQWCAKHAPNSLQVL